MDIAVYLNNLKLKYSYDDKLTQALSKIIPNMIEYYGIEYKNLILEAIEKTEIITCNELQTISLVIEEKGLIKEDNSSSIIKEDETLVGGKYISEPTVLYDEVLKTFIIIKINRYIILSHTYNLDSAAGLASLAKELIKLVKSYKNEYKINNNSIIHRCGIKEEIKQISENGNKLTLLEEKDAGLNETFNIYDEEKIVSSILKDSYTSRNYNKSKSIAKALVERLQLKESIISEELDKTKAFEVDFNKEEGMFNKLSTYADQSIYLENKCDLTLYQKEEVEKAQLQLKMLETNIATVCANYILLDKSTVNVNE